MCQSYIILILQTLQRARESMGGSLLKKLTIVNMTDYTWWGVYCALSREMGTELEGLARLDPIVHLLEHWTVDRLVVRSWLGMFQDTVVYDTMDHQ